MITTTKNIPRYSGAVCFVQKGLLDFISYGLGLRTFPHISALFLYAYDFDANQFELHFEVNHAISNT